MLIIMKKTLLLALTTTLSLAPAAGQTVLDGDMNHDGKISIEDVTLLTRNLLNDTPSTAPDYANEVVSLHLTRLGYTIPGEREPREAVSVRLVDETHREILTAEGGIRVRGNSTSGLAKKPWDLKFNEKTSMLGMPKDKRWVLLANYWDRTNLRNDVGLEIARRATGMAWNPRSQFVQLYIDGKYEGMYLICEKIKSSKSRVNITEMDVTDTAAPAVTGGYILEFDYTEDEPTYKTTSYRYDVKIKEPDAPTTEQQNYIMGYLNAFEKVLKSSATVKREDYEKYIDVNSFIDFWLVGEIVMNKDFNGPASCYMYKDRGGKLFAGPVWDLDLYTFSSTAHGGDYGMNRFLLKDGCLYYKALFTDPYFVQQAKARWQTLKASLEDGEGYSIYNYIDDRSALISDEVALDDAAYTNRQYSSKLAGDERVTHAQSVAMMKDFLTRRIAILDKLINDL